MSRIYLSPPEVGPVEREALLRAVNGGWIAPLGPEVDALEQELADVCGRSEAAALSSGTAGLHLALLLAGLRPGDRVAVSSLTFAASVNPIRYVGAEPILIDADPASWNLDPDILADAFAEASAAQAPIKAVIAVDLYGQCADYDRLEPLCLAHGAVLIEDAAEALGASYRGEPAGSFGSMAVLSFNGNKIITTSGGGALLSDDSSVVASARFLATQARDDARHYQHSRLGFNYRLSNVLAALGRAQLLDLERRVEIRRDHNRAYRQGLGDLAGVDFMPEAPHCRSTFWLTALTIDPVEAGLNREQVQDALESHDIEARPVWK
ncbi:MAG: DegT/DnrJ/EryC1/StrS family aminotransferase, partial [Candidatus Limnocylindria bacterium]